MPGDLLNTGSDLVRRLPAASCSYLDVRELLKTVDVCKEPQLSPRLRLSPVVAHVQPEVLQHLGRAAAPKAAPLFLLGLAEGSSVPFLRLRLQRLLAGRLLGDDRIAEGVASLEQGGGLSSGKHSHCFQADACRGCPQGLAAADNCIMAASCCSQPSSSFYGIHWWDALLHEAGAAALPHMVWLSTSHSLVPLLLTQGVAAGVTGPILVKHVNRRIGGKNQARHGTGPSPGAGCPPSRGTCHR